MSDYPVPLWRIHSIAAQAHEGQVDKGGLAYIGHPMRVSRFVRNAGFDREHEAVAVLHDVVEDTPVTIEELRAEGFPETTLAAIDAITQRKRESAPDYYARVCANPIARVVKWFDIQDNNAPWRMAALPSETQDRLRAKYERARLVVGPPA